MKKTFKLGYIHCAGCSVALQEKISKVPNVNSAQINFVTRIVTLDIESKNAKQTMEAVEAAIHEFDKTIKILPVHADEHHGGKQQKVQNILLMVGVVLWAIGMVVEFIVSAPLLSYLFVYLAAYALVAYPVLWQAAKNICRGKVFDENFLMSIATIGAFIIGEYVEGVAVMIFYQIGELFNHKISEHSENNIKSLASLKSTMAELLCKDGTTKPTLLEKIKIGDKIVVSAGERVALDGKIISGGSNFNTSAITGESVGKYLTMGDSVISGYIAEDGAVTIEVTADVQNCTVSKIVQMVEDALASKANIEKFISRFAKYYTPVVVSLALLICFIGPAFYGYTLAAFSTWAYRGLSFLVVSCPCALVLSVPLAYFAGIGTMAKRGILVKGSNYLEKLAKVNTIVFDKTGTLTTGIFEVEEVVSLGEKEQSEILELISYGESFSNHSIAKSICLNYCQTSGKSINIAWVNGYTEVAGGGVIANIFMEDCIVGNAKFLQDNGVEVPALDTHKTIVYLATGGVCQGYVCLADKLKPDAASTIAALKKKGITTAMFTGDNDAVAKDIAGSVGLDEYFAGLLPAQKVEKLQDLQRAAKASKKCVGFVGDGINDAPALSAADVGIAMGGKGSDIAVESADMVILRDEPSSIIPAIKIAKRTMRIVWQNIIFSIGIKLATLLLISFGLAGMWLAVFADVGVSILAVLNSFFGVSLGQ